MVDGNSGGLGARLRISQLVINRIRLMGVVNVIDGELISERAEGPKEVDALDGVDRVRSRGRTNRCAS